MTNIHVVLGNSAIKRNDMFMTLNRRYEAEWKNELAYNWPTIKDVTTYIDPTKFNNIFAQTNLDAQNFWVQIACNIQKRSKMSAKIMPNL